MKGPDRPLDKILDKIIERLNSYGRTEQQMQVTMIYHSNIQTKLTYCVQRWHSFGSAMRVAVKEALGDRIKDMRGKEAVWKKLHRNSSQS